jgi:GAF domain-containing protein
MNSVEESGRLGHKVVMSETKQATYETLLPRIAALVASETDEIAVMATMACELHWGVDYFDWTGFYRVVEPELLKVGPYQGGHGCLAISFQRGVCGKAARTGTAQIVEDVSQLPYHIACSSSTRSEIVVPVFDALGQVRAVLDVDSDAIGAFDGTDRLYLEKIIALFPSWRTVRLSDAASPG